MFVLFYQHTLNYYKLSLFNFNFNDNLNGNVNFNRPRWQWHRGNTLLSHFVPAPLT